MIMNKAHEKSVYARLQATLAVLPKLPQEIGYRSGLRVCWKTYATEDEAKIASLHARAEAEHQLALGYDFGWCAPSSITKVEDGYEVCFP